MHDRRIPEWLRHAPAPSVRGFALLAGTESIARGILVSVFPLAMYRALQDASLVSAIYFGIGIVSLLVGLLVPFLTRFVPRRVLYVTGATLFAVGAILATIPSTEMVVAGLAMTTISVVVTFVCFNAYVLDFVAKIELGKYETSRLFYSATGWTAGPLAGVLLYNWWRPAPFLIAACASLVMAAMFLYMRLGNGKLITKSKRPATNPFAYFPRFVAQPRLVTGWIFAVVRSCGWWVYVVYLPIYAVQSGLGGTLGGIAMSIASGAMFLTPFMLRFMQRTSVRYAVMTGFLMAGLLFLLAGAPLGMPLLSVLCLMIGAFFLVLLDVSAGLPFLLAVKPSERTEMSAIYSSFRDVSGILTPGVAWMVLLVAPVSGIFVAGGVGMLATWVLTSKLHPRLGAARIAMEGATDPTTISDATIAQKVV